MLQAIWQQTPESTVFDIAHLQSLTELEVESGLNALMADKIRAKTFARTNLFLVNNVCDAGHELVEMLRAAARKPVVYV